ncbi:cyclin-dependent kinase inhibitor 1B-like [Amphibalanus amphitrite]|uniref:cyclin-dependent kinase inhibitor 1B-like n=1 Tax=Amphibalanus amphitrite TaxID=1232801 RepID=UPI001C911EA7|nr:cyclin-dependent kinase inhibitor 1B-like [Amphibalanus amphitrite]
MMIMDNQNAPDLRLFYLGHAQVRRAAGSPRRRLFGPVDPAETRRVLEEEMRHIYESQKKKWNFDFEKEEPVPGGRYLWERVQPPPPEQSRTEAAYGPEPSERVQEPAAPAPAPAPVAAPAAAPSDRASNRPARSQAAITDMLRTRKRQRVSESASKASDEDPAPKRGPSPGPDAASS